MIHLLACLLCCVAAGPETPPADEPEEVRIGYFGPNDPDHAEAGAMWLAATMAIEEANLGGGYEGRPFRLMSSWSSNPWGTGIRGVTELVFKQGVWAIVGAPNSAAAHLVEQVVAKARLTFVSPVTTDKTANLANVPWIFSCAPSDKILAPLVADEMVSQTGGRGIALVCCTDHASRRFAEELLLALQKRSAFPVIRLDFHTGTMNLSAQLNGFRDADPKGVAVIAGPADSARFVSALRRAGSAQTVFGGPAMGHRLFAETAGDAADGVVFPLLWHSRVVEERAEKFARRFQERFGIEPDYTAAHTYDAVNLLIAAVRKAGLDRACIRDAVSELSPWAGVTGPITWDPTGQNHRPVGLGTIRGGRTEPYGTNRVLNRR